MFMWTLFRRLDAGHLPGLKPDPCANTSRLYGQTLLVRRGGLRQLQEEDPRVQLQFDRQRCTVVIRGRREAAERAAARLRAMVYGGGVSGNGVSVEIVGRSVVLVTAGTPSLY